MRPASKREGIRRKHRAVKGTVMIVLALAAGRVTAQDVFRFYAPPGAVYLNTSLERDATVAVTLTIEHDGVGIPAWFVAIDTGGAGVYEPREITMGANVIQYQLYGAAPPTTAVIKAPPEVLAAENVLSTGDFSGAVATPETGTVTVYAHVPSGQFEAAGEYTDSVTVSLYTGDYATPATHVLADTVSIAVTGRNASLLDIYADREPGIRFMDLTAIVANRLLATVHERSNSATGYTVSLTSANLAADTGGATSPYFAHTSATGSLDYSLTYDGAAVAGWAAGSAIVTDTAATTSPEWLTKELRISYAGSPSLPAGDYEDILTITISAK